VIERRIEETDRKKPNIYRYCPLSCLSQVLLFKHIHGLKMITCSITLTHESRITRPTRVSCGAQVVNKVVCALRISGNVKTLGLLRILNRCRR